ncbi:MAG: hypothetical protein GX638_01580 [Crenarchaeota archaeon]|nr:hypothetical protein [Thermoproteota archaeon]
MGNNKNSLHTTAIKVNLSLNDLLLISKLLNEKDFEKNQIRGQLIFVNKDILRKVRDHIIGDELAANGFDKEWNVTKYGQELERLIGLLVRVADE